MVFDGDLPHGQGHPWDADTPGQLPLAMQGAGISPRPSPAEQGAAVGACASLQGLQLVARGGVALPGLSRSSFLRLPGTLTHWSGNMGSHRSWHHPPGFTSAASQQDSGLPTSVRKAQHHPSSLKQASSKPFPAHSPPCTSAKEVLQRQILNKKRSYSQ